MLTKDQKKNIVDDLAQRFKKQKIALFSDFHKISVSRLQQLRKSLKSVQAEYKVAKKTLFDRILNQIGSNFTTKELKGEIGVVFGYGDESNTAKTLIQFAKKNETFKILAGILGDRTLNDKEIKILAKLPSKEALLAQLLGILQSPIRGLATVLHGNIRNLAVLLNKIRENKSK